VTKPERDVFARIREACAKVAERAKDVRIDAAGLARFARRITDSGAESAADPVHEAFDDPGTTLAFVITLDAINFGSGWFPLLRKRDGRSGYFTIALALRERFDALGAFSAAELRALTTGSCAELFGQPDAAAEELMAHYAQALRDLGEWLGRFHGDDFEAAVAAAEGSAAGLVAGLTQMPFYRDVVQYAGFEVPLYKRAQITVNDLASVFGGAGPGAFADIDRLTMFPDNLVPHVLRCEGVLEYSDALLARIEAGELLTVGEAAEVEIRAVGLHAVERCVELVRAAGASADARSLDTLLWQRGQRPEIKASPRHRARSTFY
jgi:hypothetical protein